MFGKKVSKQMSVSSIISAYPFAKDIMVSHGIKFIGRDLSPLEPLEKVAKGNGLGDKDIDGILSEISNYKENKNVKIDVAPEAAEKLKNVLKSKSMKAVRLRLYSDGCALYTYDMDFTNVKGGNDVEMNVNGLRMFVEKKSLDFLDGVTIRYDSAQDAFIFDNPNVKNG